MRRLTAVAALCLALSGPVLAVSPTAALLVPSPLSILLTVGKWMVLDQEQVFYVKVQAAGRDDGEARDQAFRLAVNQAVGSLLSSEYHVKNQDVVRRDIINYSSGYVRDFKILENRQEDGQVVLTVDVWVKRSRLADRLLAESRTAGEFDGNQAVVRLDSIRQERATSDRLLQQVLADYPQRAFKIDMEPSRVRFRQDRNGHLQVPFVVRWDQRYLDSLSEALKAVDQQPKCNGWLSQCPDYLQVSVKYPGFGSTQTAWFDDSNKASILQQKLILTRPAIRMGLEDGRGNRYFSKCYFARELDHGDYRPWYYVTAGNKLFEINGDRYKEFTIDEPLSGFPVEKIEQIKLEIVPTSQCK